MGFFDFLKKQSKAKVEQSNQIPDTDDTIKPDVITEDETDSNPKEVDTSDID